MSKLSGVLFGVTVALALVGVMTLGSAALCWLGKSRACIIDLMPAGGDMVCTRAPSKVPRR